MLRHFLAFFICLILNPLWSADRAWIGEWRNMLKDTAALRFLHQQLRQHIDMTPDSLGMLAREGRRLANELGDQLGQGDMALYVALSQDYKGNLETATAYYKEAAEFYQAIPHHWKTGAALTNLGINFYHRGMEDSALVAYLEAAEEYDLAGKPNGRLLNNIAIIYRRQGKYDRATEYYEGSLKLKQEAGDTLGVAAVWFNLSNLKLHQKDTVKAIPLARKALKMYADKGRIKDAADTKILLASLYRRVGELDSARLMLNEALPVYAQDSSGLYYRTFLLEMALIADLDKNWALADRYYHQAIKQAYLQDNQSELYLILQNHSEALAKLGRIQAAFDSLAKAYTLALDEKESERQALTEEMQARFEVQQAEQRSAQQAEAFALRQRNTLLITSLIGLLLVLTGIFLLRNWRQNRLLREKQAAVESALAAREAIMREMHHRIKNNLQFVSSLLRLQARDLDDPEAQDALLHSRSRVLTMAMIHKHLYEEAEQPSIRMDAYLQKLMQEIEESLVEPGKEISLKLDVAAVELDIDQAVPVALIAHEAVVNAFKHGFAGRSEGQIAIRLAEQQGHALELVVADDGIGDVGQMDESGFGQRLIHLLTERLQGSLDLYRHNGYQLRLVFPLKDSADVSL